jgi:hypothetical protein
MSIEAPINTISNGLVLHLDAANNKSYPGSGTSWADLSGNGCNATMQNGPTFNSTNGGAIVIDKVDDYAQISSNSPLFCTTGNWSCQIWCNPIDLGENNFGRIFENYDPGVYANVNLRNSGWNLIANGVDVANGIAVGQIGVSRAAPLSLFFANFFTTYSTWYNIAVTTTGVVCRVYKNGVFFGTQNFAGSNAISTMVGQNVSTYIGNRATLDRTFNGNIASVLVYPNKALSASEIIQNYDSTRSRFGL